jgi:hypothetical protein
VLHVTSFRFLLSLPLIFRDLISMVTCPMFKLNSLMPVDDYSDSFDLAYHAWDFTVVRL